eukprot:GHVP01069347.1.p1 GENE.GHVP01069347.1~~GHVP01069347.1.p1  ORF type:complete len:727 (+),score=140.88 GHVP01069347.1:106-2181(+)
MASDLQDDNFKDEINELKCTIQNYKDVFIDFQRWKKIQSLEIIKTYSDLVFEILKILLDFASRNQQGIEASATLVPLLKTIESSIDRHQVVHERNDILEMRQNLRSIIISQPICTADAVDDELLNRKRKEDIDPSLNETQFLFLATTNPLWIILSEMWKTLPLCCRYLAVLDVNWVPYLSSFSMAPIELQWAAVNFSDPRWLLLGPIWNEIPQFTRWQAIFDGSPKICLTYLNELTEDLDGTYSIKRILKESSWRGIIRNVENEETETSKKNEVEEHQEIKKEFIERPTLLISKVSEIYLHPEEAVIEKEEKKKISLSQYNLPSSIFISNEILTIEVKKSTLSIQNSMETFLKKENRSFKLDKNIVCSSFKFSPPTINLSRKSTRQEIFISPIIIKQKKKFEKAVLPSVYLKATKTKKMMGIKKTSPIIYQENKNNVKQESRPPPDLAPVVLSNVILEAKPKRIRAESTQTNNLTPDLPVAPAVEEIQIIKTQIIDQLIQTDDPELDFDLNISAINIAEKRRESKATLMTPVVSDEYGTQEDGKSWLRNVGCQKHVPSILKWTQVAPKIREVSIQARLQRPPKKCTRGIQTIENKEVSNVARREEKKSEDRKTRKSAPAVLISFPFSKPEPVQKTPEPTPSEEINESSEETVVSEDDSLFAAKANLTQMVGVTKGAPVRGELKIETQTSST